MKPTTPFIRRQALLDWLTGPGVGFTICAVRKWIATDVIPRRKIRRRKSAGEVRAYYDVAAVAAALGIDNPLSTTQPKPTQPCS